MPARSPAINENVLVGVMSVSAGLVFLDRYGIAYAFPSLRTELGLNNAQLGSLMSVTALAWAISSIVCSWLSDRFGGKARLIVVTSIFLFSLATALTSFAGTYSELIVIRIVLGALEGPVIPLMTATALAGSSPSRRGVNLGIVIAGVSLSGFALPPMLLTVLIAHFGWRHAFLVIAIPGVVLAGLLAYVMRSVDLHASDREKVDFSLPVLARILGQRNVLLAALGGGASIGAMIVFASFSPSVLIAAGGVTPGVAAQVLTVYGLLGAAGTIIAPAISDRIGRKPVLLASILTGIALPIGIVWFRDSPSALLAVMLLQLLAGGASTLFVYIIPGEAVPATLAATTFALIAAIGEIVDGSFGPWIAGVLSDLYGLDASIWTCVAMMGIAFIAALALRAQSAVVGAGALDQRVAGAPVRPGTESSVA